MPLTCHATDSTTGTDSRSGIDKPFFRWSGCDGSYVFSVYDLEKIPAYPHAVYVVVKNAGGAVKPLLVSVTNALPALFFLGGRYQAALKRGGNEVHVHVPAANVCPKTVARDLGSVMFRRRRWPISPNTIMS